MDETDQMPAVVGTAPATYHPILKALHWVVVVLFTFQFILGFGLKGSDGYTALGSQWGPVFDWHATLGLLVLVLAAIRVVMRRSTPLPSWSPGLNPFERKLAHRTEQVLYAVMFLKPISGYILAGRAGYNIDLFVQWRLGNPFGEEFVNNAGGLYDFMIIVHVLCTVAFIVAWLIHVVQVFRHTVLSKDRLLQRMLP